MHTCRLLTTAAALAAAVTLFTGGATAMAAEQYKYSTPLPPGVAIPDKVETRLGTLNFFGGFPDQTTADKLYDNLDFQRAVQAYLLALPVVNQVTNRDGILQMGPANTTVPIWETIGMATSG